ncbi:unnamed protein product [Rotaria sp. Silwood1]|nr:unnamed protein product [Rotaria sp. Silwood1]CAF3451440.1 unnamed protein product [Rotaria sp. Silwood1]CAF3510479.1 unnamed protein product [Rotaria sp. Silwood1]CAF3888636.1 unnamed protein product [Rotaria sp. Silwood1]CAF4660353.1 unnamed protein product [Rotaria sp. Silwood1]
MTNNVFLLENLPNEIIIELFKYLKARDLFQAFYNLNSRFNDLIQSLTHLTYSTDKNDNCTLSYPYIYTLIINTKIENKLTCFPNIHRIILDYVTDNLISQLNNRILPNLEYLAISHRVSPFYMPDLRAIIFSNTFPNLKYCYISRMTPPYTSREWTQSLSLRFLKLNDIDASIYISILLACPNLYFLKFKLPIKSKMQSNIVSHINLKRLIINMHYDEWPWDDSVLEDYLFCVPNLEQFKICRSISIDSNKMDYFQYYDWLSPIISKNLLVLDRFEFDLRIKRPSGLIEYDFQDICRCLKKNFNNIFQGRYQSQLLVC